MIDIVYRVCVQKPPKYIYEIPSKRYSNYMLYTKLHSTFVYYSYECNNKLNYNCNCLHAYCSPPRKY